MPESPTHFPINWFPEKVWPKYADLFINLKHFQQASIDRSINLHTAGIKSLGWYMEAMVPKWARPALLKMYLVDRKLRKAGRKPWLRDLTKRLLALQFFMKQTALRLRGPVDSWKLANCPPAGGRWTPSHRFAAGNPSGKPCTSRLCPWCWLRRYHDVKSLCLTPLGEPVRLHTGLLGKGIGLTEPVNLTRFTSFSSLLFKDRAAFIGFRTRCDAMIRRRPVVLAGNRPGTGDQPEFDVGMRLLGPAIHRFAARDGEAVADHRAMQIGYIHNHPFPDDRQDISLGVKEAEGCLHVKRLGGLTLDEAVRRVQPWPVWLADVPVETAAETLQGLRGIHTFGTVIPQRRCGEAATDRAAAAG